MIRRLQAEDYDTVCRIVNDNWKTVYQGYVNPLLLNEDGCRQRTFQLKNDFLSGRLSEYVWEENGHASALLSFGRTADTDRAGDFEIWRLYVSSDLQGKGIGSQLLSFAEQKATAEKNSSIIIWAFKNNAGALAFYHRHGYSSDKEICLGEPYQTDGIRLIKMI